MRRFLLASAMVLLSAGQVGVYGQSNLGVSTSGQIYTASGGGVRSSSNVSLRNGGTPENRWHFLGGLSLDFGGDAFQITLSPQVGYAVTNYLVLGAGVNYSYFDTRSDVYKMNALGVNVFARAFVLQYITFHLQPERSWRWVRPGDAPAVGTESVLFGAGLTYPVSGRGYVSAMLFYDLLQRPASPYGNRIFYSVGYGFRF